MIKYRKIKGIVLIFGMLGIFGGTLVSALMIRQDAEAIDFVIDSETVRKYGYFDDICETTLTGTILKPIDDLRDDVKRPCVFVFHGMFLNRFMQIQTAMYFAKAGMYVVMFDDPGQGESKGCYRLGYELEAIGKTAIDYFIAEGFKKYNMNVDLDALGVNGHSYGGITSTFAGINKPDKIKAVAAIWAWSELTQTVSDIAAGLGTDFEEDFLNSAMYRFLTKLTGFGDALYYDRDGDYSTKKEDIIKTLNDRNTIDKVSFENKKPPNYLLISAYHEELITPDQLMELMATASYNETGGVSYDYVYNEIKNAFNNGEDWSNLDVENKSYKGDFDSKTARELYMPKKTKPFGHLMEGFLVDAYIKILEWFGKAFNWDVKDVVNNLKDTGISTDSLRNVDGPLPAEAFWKWAGWIIALLGLLIALPAMVSYLIRFIYFKNSEKKYQSFIKEFIEPEKDRFGGLENKLIASFLIIYIIAELFSIIIPISLGITPKMIGIPFIIADALILIMLGRSFIVIPVLLILLLYFFKKTNIRLNAMGIPSKSSQIIKDIIIGLTVAFIFFIGFNLIGIISVSSRLIPRYSPSLGYFGFLLLLIYLFIFFFFDELIFRGCVQTKIHNYIYTKLERRPQFLKKWLEFITACSVQVTTIILGIFLGLIIATGGIPPILVASFLFMGLSVSFIPPFLSTYIYQRTKSIIPCTIASTIIIAFLLGGSFIGAITF
ncbi:MAG: alpha/beta hydrolase family protein [Promethearchaeia archaeon]